MLIGDSLDLDFPSYGQCLPTPPKAWLVPGKEVGEWARADSESEFVKVVH